MKSIENIIVPVDYLRNTDKLVEYAVYVADKLSAAIYFIHVIETHIDWLMTESQSYREVEENRFDAAQLHMRGLVGENKGRNFECKGEVLTGDPADEIVEFAKKRNGDMIIISTHGTKGLEKILLGSVTKRVLKRAHCPVLVINPYKD